MTNRLILARHGLSLWNKKNLFTGWVDVPLSKEGIGQAQELGRKLDSPHFEAVFTSDLVRAQMTAHIAIAEHEAFHPLVAAPALKERNYGLLQGMDKDEARKKWGKEQVELWRRSFRGAPPEGESLHDTARRVIPYFEQEIKGRLQKGDVLIVAHQNSLRSLIMHLDSLSEEEVVLLELPCAEPIVYTL